MKAWMSPIRTWPWIASQPPITATATKPRLPMIIIAGIIRPERNCDFHALSTGPR